ncbi:MAG: DUF2911 domain-containing protein [Daejeonella sp.]
MKKIAPSAVFLLCSFFFAPSYAQLRMPPASSSQTIVQEFGLGTVTVKYSRPNVKGRSVFTELAPYGEVWRTGANNATVITFTDNITLEGNPVKAGEYGLFSIPGKDSWTIILNKSAQQWGAYKYKQDDDVLRFQVKPAKVSDKAESFSIAFTNVMPSSAKLNLLWDDTKVAINMVTDVDSKVMAAIDESMKGDKKPYFQAAQYYYDNNKDLGKALQWINTAEAADQKAPWIKYWKARIQLKAGDKAGSAASARAGIEAAKAMNVPEYVRLNGAVLLQASK